MSNTVFIADDKKPARTESPIQGNNIRPTKPTPDKHVPSSPMDHTRRPTQPSIPDQTDEKRKPLPTDFDTGELPVDGRRPVRPNIGGGDEYPDAGYPDTRQPSERPDLLHPHIKSETPFIDNRQPPFKGKSFELLVKSKKNSNLLSN